MSVFKIVKRFMYGVVPFLFIRMFDPNSPKCGYYQFIREHGYTHYPYAFAEEYLHIPVQIRHDSDKNLPYVVHRGSKRLYFPKEWSDKRVEGMYRALMIEQDSRHPHHYVDSLEEFKGKTLLDVGAAEGFTSLDAIERVDFIYLFECAPEWVEALTATFEPWQDKVCIIQKYIGKHDDQMNLTLDRFLENKRKDNLFLKMDIEGAECDALEGCKTLFAEAIRLDFAICTYHRKDDEKRISFYLDQYHCTYSSRQGYMYVKHKLRPCLIRGAKSY